MEYIHDELIKYLEQIINYSSKSKFSSVTKEKLVEIDGTIKSLEEELSKLKSFIVSKRLLDEYIRFSKSLKEDNKNRR